MTSEIPPTTKSWTTNLDGIPALTLRSSPTPQSQDIPPNHILVRILSVSLNYKDAEIINGLFKHHKSSVAPPDLVPCADSVGVIVAIGPVSSDASTQATPKWTTGDHVLSVSYPNYMTGPANPTYLAAGVGSAVNGVLTTYRIFPAHGVVACPPSLITDPDLACCLPIAGTTAWMGLNWWRPLTESSDEPADRSHETLLLQGTGGVSMFGLLFGAAMKFQQIILTSGSDEKLARAQTLLPTSSASSSSSTSTKLSGINYRKTPQWHRRVLALTSNVGVDIIFENGGGGDPSTNSTWRSLQCIKFGGVINSIGYVGGKTDTLSPKSTEPETQQEPDSTGPQPTADPADQDAANPTEAELRTNINVLALARNAILKGMLNGPRDRMEEMLRFVEMHKIRPVVDKVFSFEEAREALQYLWDGKHFGKVVIQVSES